MYIDRRLNRHISLREPSHVKILKKKHEFNNKIFLAGFKHLSSSQPLKCFSECAYHYFNSIGLVKKTVPCFYALVYMKIKILNITIFSS